MNYGDIYRLKNNDAANKFIQMLYERQPPGEDLASFANRLRKRAFKLRSAEYALTGGYDYVIDVDGGLLAIFDPEVWISSAIRFNGKSDALGRIFTQLDEDTFYEDLRFESISWIMDENLRIYRNEIIYQRMEQVGMTWEDLILEYAEDDGKNHHVVECMLEKFSHELVMQRHKDAGLSFEQFQHIVDKSIEFEPCVHYDLYCKVWGLSRTDVLRAFGRGRASEIIYLCLLWIENLEITIRDGIQLMKREGVSESSLIENFYGDDLDVGISINEEQFQAEICSVYGCSHERIILLMNKYGEV